MKKLLIISLLLVASVCYAAELTSKQFMFNAGKWMPNSDASTIGAKNFTTLTNSRYADSGLIGHPGYSKVNATTALSTYTKIRNGHQLRTDRTTPSVVLIQAEDATGDSVIYQNQTAIPDIGDFETTALHTDATGANTGRFSDSPTGIAYCNGVECNAWWGPEGRVAGFFVVSDVIETDNDIALNDNGAGADTIVATAGSFLDKGFRIGQTITVSGAATAGNNGDYEITDISSDGLTISIATGSLANTDAAGASTVTVEAASGVDYADPIDYTDAINNELTTAGNLAILGGGDDSDAVLLLHMNGTDGDNTFTDDSASAHTVTPVGNIQLDTAQQKFGTASGLSDSTGDYLSVSDHANWNYGTDEVTLETWYRLNSTDGVQVIASQYDNTNGDTATLFFYNNTLHLVVHDAGGTLQFDAEVSWTPSLNTWYHIAVIRGWGGNANDWAITVDGTSVTTFTDASTWPDHPDALTIGGMETDQEIDVSVSHHVVKFAGTAVVSASVVKYGDASLYLDGNSDDINTPDHADFDIHANTTDDYTIDFWVKHTDHAGTEVYLHHYEDVNNHWILQRTDADGIKWSMDSGGGALEIDFNSTAANDIATTNWVHLAFVKVDDDYAIYKDGARVASLANELDTDTFAGVLYVGRHGSPGSYFDGYIDELRIQKGNPFSADPTSANAITVPTSAHTPDADTKLLLHCDTKSIDGWLDEFRISKDIARWTANFTAPVRAYRETQRRWYVFSTRPLQGIKYYVQTGNVTASTMSGWEWTGKSFSSLTLTDNTDTGASLAQTGTVTFTSTESTAKPWHFEGLYLYAYMFELDDGGAEIYYATVDADFQPIVDVWDGVERSPIEFQMKDDSENNWDDWTLSVNQESSNLYPIGAELVDGANLMTADDYLIAGFDERMTAIRYEVIGERANTAAAQPTIYYWSGTDWVTVGDVVDTTATRETDFVSLSQTGLMSWYPPAEEDEAKRTLFGRTGYYYKVKFDAALAGSGDAPEVVIDLVTGIPAQYTVPPFSFPAQFKNRLFLFGYTEGKEGNRADFSMPSAPDVWNGDLSSMNGLQSLYFGNHEAVVAAGQIYNRYGSSVVTGLMTLKKTSTSMLIGDDPEDFKIFPVSENLGCVAPRTLVAAEMGYQMAENINRNIRLWLSHAGPVIFDGAVLKKIEGVENFFDPVETECVEHSIIDRSWGVYDPLHSTYYLGIPSGSGATEVNKILAYDLKYKRWFEVAPTTYPQAAWPVFDTDGIRYLYGGIDTGYMLRLNNGTSWAGSAITQTVETGDFLIYDYWTEARIRRIGVTAKRITEDATLSIYHYADTADDDATVDATLDLDAGSNRLTESVTSLNSESNRWHRLKFEVSTSATEKGAQLFGWGFQAQPGHAWR